VTRHRGAFDAVFGRSDVGQTMEIVVSGESRDSPGPPQQAAARLPPREHGRRGTMKHSKTKPWAPIEARLSTRAEITVAERLARREARELGWLEVERKRGGEAKRHRA
jgi:hypothetical protein